MYSKEDGERILTNLDTSGPTTQGVLTFPIRALWSSVLEKYPEPSEGGAAIPINTMVATRGGKLGRGTGFGIGEGGEAGYTITANHPHAVAKASGRQGRPSMVVRRLTPTECERLQGFPDDWTLIEWKGRPAEECPDTPRYKAIGNSMAVPVMRWIGERIAPRRF